MGPRRHALKRKPRADAAALNMWLYLIRAGLVRESGAGVRGPGENQT